MTRWHCKQNSWLESRIFFDSLNYVFRNLKMKISKPENFCITVEEIPLPNIYITVAINCRFLAWHFMKFHEILGAYRFRWVLQIFQVIYLFWFWVFCYGTSKPKSKSWNVSEKEHWINFFGDWSTKWATHNNALNFKLAFLH